MDTITYKCPNCDGGLVFDPESQKFKCEYCLSEFAQEELGKCASDTAAQQPGIGSPSPGGDASQSGAENGEEDGAEDSVTVYTCPSCGAQILADETTAATYCYYCHNPVVLSGRLDGRYRPDCVIPFELDRKSAEERFKSWIRRKRYVPRDFYSPKQMELLEGIYYPYWLYTCEVEGKIEAEAVKRQVSRLGSIENIELSYYRVERDGSMRVEHVARNALSKAEHRLSEAVLPFEMGKVRPFTAGYLSGFRAERRDVEREAVEQEVEEEVREFAVAALRDSISNYDTVTVRHHEERLCSPQWKYALLPVWILTYRGKKDGKIYYFAMNGQSGKICGVLPVDGKRLAGLFAAIFLPLFFLFLLGGYLI